MSGGGQLFPCCNSKIAQATLLIENTNCSSVTNTPFKPGRTQVFQHGAIPGSTRYHTTFHTAHVCQVIAGYFQQSEWLPFNLGVTQHATQVELPGQPTRVTLHGPVYIAARPGLAGGMKGVLLS